MYDYRKKNNRGQTCSCPREPSLSASWGNLRTIKALSYWGVLRAPLIGPPWCRETPVSQTAFFPVWGHIVNKETRLLIGQKKNMDIKKHFYVFALRRLGSCSLWNWTTYNIVSEIFRWFYRTNHNEIKVTFKTKGLYLIQLYSIQFGKTIRSVMKMVSVIQPWIWLLEKCPLFLILVMLFLRYTSRKMTIGNFFTIFHIAF